MEKSLLRSALAICVVLAFGTCGLEDKKDQPVAQATAAPQAQAQQSSASGGGSQPVVPLPNFTPLIEKEGPAVVNVIGTRKAVANRRSRPQPEDDPLLEFFRRFMPDQPGSGQGEARQGLGSGFIISPDGHILTNAHVVADFDEVTVRLADAKREFKAKVVGLDKRTDVALIKVDATGLPTATMGSSEKLQPGEWVAAIGSPFGFANTITQGIVSAKGRSLPDEMYVPFIQTDVAVNPGNSGGPLINLAGEVVGINSMIYSRTGGYMGVSFAIPIEVALEVAKQLQSTGKVTRGRMGVGIQPLTKELAQSFKLDSSSGAVVVNVEPGSPADKAGLKLGDVILAYNGKQLDDPTELPRLVAATKPGDKATLEIWRSGKREQVAVAVGEFPDEKTTASREAPQKAASANQLGLAVRELPPEERKTLGVDYGLLVEDIVDGPAARSPIQPGDVIVAVNQDKFGSLDEFNKLIGQRKKGESVALLVKRGPASVYVPIEIS
jgi:serine protease Do